MYFIKWELYYTTSSFYYDTKLNKQVFILPVQFKEEEVKAMFMAWFNGTEQEVENLQLRIVQSKTLTINE